MAEVEVYGYEYEANVAYEVSNVALRKPATQSTVDTINGVEHSADLAVNGDSGTTTFAVSPPSTESDGFFSILCFDIHHC